MLTPRQHECLAFLQSWFANHAVAPSVREVAHGLGLTAGPTHRLLVALEEQGFIRWAAGSRRAIRLLPPAAPDVIAAARAVLAAILSEDLATGRVVVTADAIGALDIALAEAGALPTQSHNKEKLHARTR